MKPNSKRVQRGEIYWCDLGEAVGSEQGGCRPVIIVQNDIGNNYSTTTIVVPLTTKLKKTKLPTHHEFVNNGVKQVACAEQIRTVDKLRLGTNLGFVRKEDVDKISHCVHVAVEEIKFQQKLVRGEDSSPKSKETKGKDPKNNGGKSSPIKQSKEGKQGKNGTKPPPKPKENRNSKKPKPSKGESSPEGKKQQNLHKTGENTSEN